MVTKNKRLFFCFGIALFFGFPFPWLQYKGEGNRSFGRISDLGFHNLFFDFSILLVNTLIIFFVWTRIFSLKKAQDQN